jgi:hypothetical protein
MPSSSAEIDSLLEYTRLAARTLQDVAGADASLLKAVSGATLLVIPLVQVGIIYSTIDAVFLNTNRMSRLIRSGVCV